MYHIIDGMFKIKPDFLEVFMSTCANNMLNDYILAMWQQISHYYNQSTKSTPIERFREKVQVGTKSHFLANLFQKIWCHLLLICLSNIGD